MQALWDVDKCGPAYIRCVGGYLCGGVYEGEREGEGGRGREREYDVLYCSHTRTHSHVLPGKPFSTIPLLTSTPGRLTNSQSTPYVRLTQPDRPDLLTDQSSTAPSTACAVAVSDSAHCGGSALKLNESQSEYDFDYGESQGVPLTSRYPSDAKFPGKHGAAALFLANCLSNKHKEQHDNH